MISSVSGQMNSLGTWKDLPEISISVVLVASIMLVVVGGIGLWGLVSKGDSKSEGGRTRNRVGDKKVSNSKNVLSMETEHGKLPWV